MCSVCDDGLYGLNPVDYVNKESKFFDKIYDGLVKEETNIRGLIEDTQAAALCQIAAAISATKDLIRCLTVC